MRFIPLILIAMLPASCVYKQQKEARQLPFYTTSDFTPRWIKTAEKEYKNIPAIPPFKFIDQLGDSVDEKTFEGKIYVANFFFTACPGICKQLTKGMKVVQTAYLKDDNVLLLSHSVTPDRDSVKILKQYATTHGIVSSKWHLVTGNKKEIYSLARQSYFADEDLGEVKDQNDFLHTENIVLVDKKRRIRGIYKGTDMAEINNLVDDIKVLEQEAE